MTGVKREFLEIKEPGDELRMQMQVLPERLLRLLEGESLLRQMYL